MQSLSTSLVIGKAIKPSQPPPRPGHALRTSAQMHEQILKSNPNMRGRNMLTAKMSEKKHFIFTKRKDTGSAYRNSGSARER